MRLGRGPAGRNQTHSNAGSGSPGSPGWGGLTPARGWWRQPGQYPSPGRSRGLGAGAGAALPARRSLEEGWCVSHTRGEKRASGPRRPRAGAGTSAGYERWRLRRGRRDEGGPGRRPGWGRGRGLARAGLHLRTHGLLSRALGSARRGTTSGWSGYGPPLGLPDPASWSPRGCWARATASSGPQGRRRRGASAR